MTNKNITFFYIFFILAFMHTSIFGSLKPNDDTLVIDYDTKFCKYCEPIREKLHSAKKNYNDLIIKYQELNRKNQKLNKKIISLEKSNNNLADLNEKNKAHQIIHEEKIKNLKNTHKDLNTQITDLNNRNSSLENKNNEYFQDILNLKKEINNSHCNQKTDAKSSHTINLDQKKGVSLNLNNISTNEDSGEINSKKDAQIKTLKQEIKELKEKNTKLTDELVANYINLSKEIAEEEYKTKIHPLESRVVELINELNEAKKTNPISSPRNSNIHHEIYQNPLSLGSELDCLGVEDETEKLTKKIEENKLLIYTLQNRIEDMQKLNISNQECYKKDLENLTQKNNQLSDNTSKVQESLFELTNEINALLQEKLELEAQLTTLKKEYEEINKQNVKLQEQAKNLKNKIISDKTKILHNQSIKHTEYAQELLKHTKEIDVLKKEKDAINKKYSDLTSAIHNELNKYSELPRGTAESDPTENVRDALKFFEKKAYPARIIALTLSLFLSYATYLLWINRADIKRFY